MSIQKYRRKLSGGNYQDENFENLDLRFSLAVGATFRNCLFKNCKLDQSDFRGAHFVGTTFDDCSIQHAQFQARFESCVFVDSNLDGSVFAAAPISQTYFEKCRLEYAVFSRATVVGGGMVDSALHGAYLDFAESLDVDFSGSNLWGAVVPLGCALIVDNQFDHRQVQLMLALMTKAKASPSDLDPIRGLVEPKYMKLVERLAGSDHEKAAEQREAV